ncbi:MAG: prefoldin subunit alpha [Candidatus Bathyarchaeia archaeon]
MESQRRAEEEELRRLLIETELLEGTLATLRGRLDLVNAGLTESRLAVQALTALKSEKKDAETLVHVGAGSYIKARLDDVEKVVVGVGAEVSIEKSLDEALESLEQQVSQLEKSKAALEQQWVQASAALDEDRRRVAEIARRRQEATGPARQA